VLQSIVWATGDTRHYAYAGGVSLPMTCVEQCVLFSKGPLQHTFHHLKSPPLCLSPTPGPTPGITITIGDIKELNSLKATS
jgi:hypothetical protein